MLRLLQRSKSLRDWEDYYNIFTPTRKLDSIVNEYQKIKLKCENAQLLFVDGRNLLTTDNDNLLPFVGNDKFTIFNVHQFDNYNESKLTLKEIAINFSEWIQQCIIHCSSLRWLVIDFSRHHENIIDVDDSTYSRNDLYYASTRLYATLSLYAWDILKSGKLIHLKNSIKIIMHYGDSLISPMIINIPAGDFNPDNTLIYIPYHTNSADDRSKNEWLQRYNNTIDCTGFMIDLLERNEMSDCTNVLMYTFDENCYAPLLRMILQRHKSKITNLNVLLLSHEDKLSVFADLVSSKDLIFNVLAETLKGSIQQLLTDIFIMDMIASFFTDIDHMLEVYSNARGDLPIFQMNWKTLKYVMNQSSFRKICSAVRAEDVDSTMIEKKLALTVFIADFASMLEVPVPMHRIKDRSLTTQMIIQSIRIWITTQLGLMTDDDSLDKNLISDIRIFYMSYALAYLLPYIIPLFGNTINTISELIQYITTNESVHIEIFRDMLTPDGYQRMYLQEMRLFNPIENQDTADDIFIRDNIMMKDFIAFLEKFDSYWSRKIWNNGVFSINNTLLYDKRIRDEFRCMFINMSKRRIQYMKQSKLIITEHGTTSFNIDIRWKSENIQTHLLEMCLYQFVRSKPNTWKFYYSQQLNIQQYESIIAQTKLNDITGLIDYNGDYSEVIETVYDWKDIPLDIHKGIRDYLINSGGTFSKRWKYMKTILPRIINYNSNGIHTELIELPLPTPSTEWTSTQSFLYSSTDQKIDSITKLIVPLIRNIFYLEIPNNVINPIQCSISLELSDIILYSDLFTMRDRIPIHIISSFMECIAMSTVQMNNECISVLYSTCVIILRKLELNIKDVEHNDAVTEELIKQLHDQVNLHTRINDWKEVIDVTQTSNDKEFIMYLLHWMNQSGISSNSDTITIIKWIARLFELVNERMRSAKHMLMKSYPIAIDFSFDLLQPLLEDKLEVCYRLYEIHDGVTATTDSTNEISNNTWLDVDNIIVNIKTSSHKTEGVAPHRLVAIRDQLDDKYYITAVWDLKPFYKPSTGNIMDSITTLEIEAAAWWLSVPNIRAKVRARGGPWRASHWSLWLIQIFESSLTHNIHLNPVVQAANRIKTFNIPYSATIKPSGKLVSEECGLFLSDMKLLRDTLFNNGHVTDNKLHVDTFKSVKLAEPTEVRKRYTELDDKMRKYINEQQQSVNNETLCLPIHSYYDLSTPESLSLSKCSRLVYINLPAVISTITPDVHSAVDKHKELAFGSSIIAHPKVLTLRATNSDKKSGVKGNYTFVEEHTVCLKEILNVDTHIVYQPLIQLVRKYLPIFHGVCYKFLIYYKIPKQYTRVYTDGRSENATLDEFRNEKWDNIKHYDITINIDLNTVSNNAKYIYQGVYGNSNNINLLYHLFYYVRNICYTPEFTGLKKQPILSSYHESELLNLNRGFKIVEKLTSTNVLDPIELINDPRNYFSSMKDIRLQVRSVEHVWSNTFTGHLTPSNFSHYTLSAITHWMYTMVSNSMTYLPTSMNLFEFIEDISGAMDADERTYRIVYMQNTDDLPFTHYTTIPAIMNPDIYDSSVIMQDVNINIVRLLQRLVFTVKRLKNHTKKYMSDIIFIVNVLFIYPLLQSTLIHKSLPVIYLQSRDVEISFANIFTDFIDTQLLGSEDITDLLNLLDNDKHLLYVHDIESAVILRETFENLLDESINTDTIEYILSDIANLLPPETALLVRAAGEEDDMDSETISLIADSDRPRMMKGIIKSISLGSYKFRTTYHNYSTLDIHVNAPEGIDEDIEWEEIQEKLSEQQLELFMDADQTDSELLRLEQSIDISVGAVKNSKIRSRERIIHELTDGRKLMMTMLASSEPNPLKDSEVIKVIYDITNTKSAKVQKTSISNQFDHEIKLRQNLTRLLRTYNLTPLFTGEYDSDATTKEKREKFTLGLTIYKSQNKKNKFKVNKVASLVQSILLNMFDQEDIFLTYYMTNETLEEVLIKYESEPTIDVQDGDSVETTTLPIAQLLSDIIDDTYYDSLPTSMDAILFIYNHYIEPHLRVNMKVISIKYSKQQLHKISVQDFTHSEEAKWINILHVVPSNNNDHRKLEHFEPLRIL